MKRSPNTAVRIPDLKTVHPVATEPKRKKYIPDNYTRGGVTHY